MNARADWLSKRRSDRQPPLHVLPACLLHMPLSSLPRIFPTTSLYRSLTLLSELPHHQKCRQITQSTCSLRPSPALDCRARFRYPPDHLRQSAMSILQCWIGYLRSTIRLSSRPYQINNFCHPIKNPSPACSARQTTISCHSDSTGSYVVAREVLAPNYEQQEAA